MTTDAKKQARAEADRMRRSKDTYLKELKEDDPVAREELLEFLQEFNRNWRDFDPNPHLQKYPVTVGKFYNSLGVNQKLFWQRYIYRTDEERLTRKYSKDEKPEKKTKVSDRYKVSKTATANKWKSPFENGGSKKSTHPKYKKYDTGLTGFDMSKKIIPDARSVATMPPELEPGAKRKDVDVGLSVKDRMKNLKAEKSTTKAKKKTLAEPVSTGASVSDRMKDYWAANSSKNSPKNSPKPDRVTTGASLQDRMKSYTTTTASTSTKVMAPPLETGSSVKDRMKTAAADVKEASCNLGTGKIDFPKILKVASDNGMKFFIMEQERYDGSTPLQSAEIGADYLKKLVFQSQIF